MTACGVTAAFPVELGDSPILLTDYLTSVSRDGDAVSVTISGARGLDAAVQLCDQALAENEETGHPISLQVNDSYSILLATLDEDGKCIVNPEFAP